MLKREVTIKSLGNIAYDSAGLSWTEMKTCPAGQLRPQEDIDRDYGSLWLVPTPPDCLTIQADSLVSQQGGGG